ncbi:L-fucose/L-arabinose isomerase family protein [Thermodesulfobacteriota bacterium]
MDQPRVGLMTFGDQRQDMWEKLFGPLTEPRHKEAVEYLETLPVDLKAFKEVARSREEIDSQIDQLIAAGVEVFIAHIPCWSSPNLVARGVQRITLPTVLITSRSPATHGTVGLLGAAGTLDQIGISHVRIREDFGTPAMEEKLLPFIRAAGAKGRLQGETLGLFGGRSLGIDTGTFDPMQWRSQFGVDVEHIDQLEIIRRAEMVNPERTRAMMEWLSENTGKIEYNDTRLTSDKLSFQVRCYLATKDIISEKGLDFVAIKCMPDLTDHYIPQCISAAFLPGPFDAEGQKGAISMACEADGDGALTMEILKHISGGKPVLFGDVSHLNDETRTMYVPNCGAMCAWYAGRSDDPATSLKSVELRPSVRPAGGATVYFTAAPGPITLARLCRRSGHYRMIIVPGEAIEPAKEELDTFIEARGKHQLPTAFVKVAFDFDRFVDEFGSNHISGVAGSYAKELEQFCRMSDVTPVVMGGDL